MAALDPTIPPNSEDADSVPRATLRIIKEHIDFDDDDDEDEDEDSDDDSIGAIERRLAGAISDEDEDEESDDEEQNGGPSDPAKSKKAQKIAALKALTKAISNKLDDEEEDDTPNGVNGVKKNKGKGKSSPEASISDISMSDDDGDSEGLEFEEFVVCTLDTDKVSRLRPRTSSRVEQEQLLQRSCS
jgi:FK506-binding nuclear protein